MKKVIIIAVFFNLVMIADAWSRDSVWIPNYDIYGNSVIMERSIPSHNTLSFLQNPALMPSQSGVIIDYDFYVQKMAVDMDLRQENYQPSINAYRLAKESRDERYVWYSYGPTVGVIHDLGRFDSLGIVFTYHRGDVHGEGDWDVNIVRSGGVLNQELSGSTEYNQGMNAHTLDLIWRRKNESISYGAGLNFSFNDKAVQSALSAQVSDSSTFPSESNKIRFYDDRSDNRIGAILGLEWNADPRFNLSASLSTGFRFGNGDRDIFAKTTGWLGPSTIVYNYRGDLDAAMNGFDVGLVVKPTILLKDGFSLPFSFSLSYLNEDWDMEGTGDGFFFSFTLLYPSFGHGDISFDEEMEHLNIKAGTGLLWERGPWVFSFSLGYEYEEQSTGHDRNNDVNQNEPSMLPLTTKSHNFFDQDEKWREHNLMLGFGGNYDFSDRLQGTLYVNYTHRWIKAHYTMAFYDAYWHWKGVNPKGVERYRASESCTASDLAFQGALSFRPNKNIEVKLNAGVMIPVSDSDLDLDGDINGGNWATTSWLTYAYGQSSRDIAQHDVHYSGALYFIWLF